MLKHARRLGKDRTYHDAHQSGGEDDDTDHRDNPENTLVCRPPIQEETDGQSQTARDGENRRDPDLGLVFDALGLLAFDHIIRKQPEPDHSNHHANTGWQKRQSNCARTEVVDATVDIRKCGDEKIEDAVSDGDVEGWEGNDRRKDEQLEWADNGALELVGSIAMRLQYAAQARVTCLLAEPVDSALQDDRRITLAKDEESNRGANTALFIGNQSATRPDQPRPERMVGHTRIATSQYTHRHPIASIM